MLPPFWPSATQAHRKAKPKPKPKPKGPRLRSGQAGTIHSDGKRHEGAVVLSWAEQSTVLRLTDTDPVETLTVVGPRNQRRWPGRHRRGTKDHGTNQTPRFDHDHDPTMHPETTQPKSCRLVLVWLGPSGSALTCMGLRLPVPHRDFLSYIHRDPENQVEVNPPVFYSRRDHVFMSTPPPALTWCFSSSHHTL